jgi:hypothetical protein
VAARRALRERLRRAIQNSPGLAPRPQFVRQLRSKLRGEADHVTVRRRLTLQRWTALAATVLLAVTIALVYRNRVWIAPTDALARAAVGDHRDCALQFKLAEKPISLGEAAGRYGARFRALERLPASEVITATGPARVVERHVCVYRGQRFAHIVLEYRNTRVSLLMAEDEGSGRREFPALAPQHVAPASQIDGMSVASFQTPGHIAFLVGDLAEADLARLAGAVAAQLSRELSRA